MYVTVKLLQTFLTSISIAAIATNGVIDSNLNQ